MPALDLREWLEADGLGGFASGTVSGLRTRRYHALLLAATTPPTGRMVLVNGFEAEVETLGGHYALTSQRYAPGMIHPDGHERMAEFKADPWPHWTYRLEDGTTIEQEVFVPRGIAAVALRWRRRDGRSWARLKLRPLLSGRDYHALHNENSAFCFHAEVEGERVTWRPYHGIPAIAALSNGLYAEQPLWYRDFLYSEERSRGLEHMEDLASPGFFTWDLAAGDAVLLLSCEGTGGLGAGDGAVALAERWASAETKNRGAFPSRLHRAAEAYVVRRGEGKTVLAGYPWFSDWGRDCFIALRGLCLATGRYGEARDILMAWSGFVSEGMLPNRFPDAGEKPEYNAVDASLWFVVAVHEFLAVVDGGGVRLAKHYRRRLEEAVQAILKGYSRGTRFAIHAAADGLLAAGVPGLQLTWCDAIVGGEVVTPRIGKPVEVQALWINALRAGARIDSTWTKLAERGVESFAARFWNESRGFLNDVVDVDHVHGAFDATLRPNQLFAVGGLPWPVLAGARARAVVDVAEKHLWTPLGLRSLASFEAGYRACYEGGPEARDRAYHEGTVWPWLLGPFVEAWVRVRRGTVKARREARERFLVPLLAQLDAKGLGHLPEIADGDPPHTPRGCPFQAWSVGEALRLDLAVLSDEG